ncbi:hypothetical protein CON71_17610 [Bacillus thuringiensis]|uniref:Uncharacterized protein n=1 Tax=Bacillus thuringiensis TaxID=1428 RepID=A0A9X6Y9X6_BACTU|nr:hypothetical protein CON71_17610 [Bacillus thuringiensis]
MSIEINNKLIFEETLQTRIKELALQIEHDFKNEEIILITVLKDSFIFVSGLTPHFLKEHFYIYKPKALKFCSLLDKPERRKVDLDVEYVSFRIPDECIGSVVKAEKSINRNR